MSQAGDVAPPQGRVTRAEFQVWVDAQPRGRLERIDGEVVATVPERVTHVRVKARAWLALRTAIAASGVRCEAFTDGLRDEGVKLMRYFDVPSIPHCVVVYPKQRSLCVTAVTATPSRPRSCIAARCGSTRPACSLT